MAPTRPTESFRQRVERIARQALAEAVPPQQVAQAVSRVALAFGAAHRAARDPSSLEACSDASIGACIALSALTGLMPGGAHAVVYLVPQAARRGEQPELQWRPTHRGYSALALEDAGLVLLPVAAHDGDDLEIAFGEVFRHVPADASEVVLGVYVTIRRAADGVVLSRPWISSATIERSRKMSKAGAAGPWNTHYEEMALAAAIRWCHGRGMIPSSSTRLQTAMVEEAAEELAPVVAAPRVRRISQAAPESRQIEEAPPAEDMAAEIERLRSREAERATRGAATRDDEEEAP